MSDKTGIEWTTSDDGTPGATWNPVTGCTKISLGCDRCYAETFAERWRGIPGHHFEQGFDVQLRPDKLTQPLRWTRPRRIFVNSMSDLFHDAVPDHYIADVFAVMARARQHTFQLLTKRHGRMRSLLSRASFQDCVTQGERPWPLPNLWLGVSVEDQHWADIRIPALLATPAAVRFLSCEPLLGPVDLMGQPGSCEEAGPAIAHHGYSYPVDYGTGTESDCEHQAGIDWTIVGGESGPGARPMSVTWARSLVAQCQEAEVPVFVKQLGSVLGKELGAGPKGGDFDAFPEDLKVREFPASPVAVSS